MSTDVLGRLVEVLLGKALDEYFTQEIFTLLSMHDTAFLVVRQKIIRLVTLYTLFE